MLELISTKKKKKRRWRGVIGRTSPRILTSEEKATATKEIKLNEPGIHKITKAEFLVVDEAWKLYSARPKERTLDS